MNRPDAVSGNAGAFAGPLDYHDETEGIRLPEGLGAVIDAHVHVFPDNLMAAVQAWFDAHGYRLRYRMSSDELIEFLLGRGLSHLVLLHYAHKPGLAREMNRYVGHLCRKYDHVTGLATVFPGEEGALDILKEGLDLGLKGVKLHAHVQCFDVGGDGVREVCGFCQERRVALIAHLGREPKSAAYKCDPFKLCSVDRVTKLLDDFPELKLCVPHLGAGEFEAYRQLMFERDNLWLDTTMMLGGFFKSLQPPPLSSYRPERLMYGSDFCNIPTAWDRELKAVASQGLERETLEAILHRTARDFYSIDV